MRTITSLRWRSAQVLSTAEAWSQSRWTSTAATICGCSWRSSSPTERVHPLQVLDAGQVARSAGCGRSASSPCPRRAPSSARCARTCRCRRRRRWPRDDGRELLQDPVEALARHRVHARDGLAEPLHLARRQVAQHLAASSSPSDIGGSRRPRVRRSSIAMRVLPGSVSPGGSGRRSPLTQPRTMPATAARVVLGERLGALELLPWPGRPAPARRRSDCSRRRRQSIARPVPGGRQGRAARAPSSGRGAPGRAARSRRSAPGRRGRRRRGHVERLRALPDRHLTRLPARPGTARSSA